jgi:c-di-GMP-binding flagellar brake protein YcgR
VGGEGLQTVKVVAERRQHRRVKLVTQVRCEALGCCEIRLTEDIGVGGMFFHLRFPLPIGSEMSISFRLYPADPAITCRARVTFSRVGQGMGIEFLDLSENARRLIEKFVDEAA